MKRFSEPYVAVEAVGVHHDSGIAFGYAQAQAALAEIGYLLTGRYGIDRPWVVQGLIDLLNRSNTEAHGVPTDLAIEALAYCAPSAGVSFTGAMLWAVARHAGASVWTLDRAFPSDGIERREPSAEATSEG